ncbi:MAG TPA: hypothetical protein VGC72_06490 [Candidatus Elarobacter sp.]
MTTRTAFRWCLGVAFLGIVASTAYSIHDTSAAATTQAIRVLIFLALGAGPILPYYLVVRERLRTSPASVAESSIDSVYYLGFLITLTTLLVSVILYGWNNAGGSKNPSINVVFIGVSFGLSLAATAGALFARVDLVQQRDSAPVTDDAEVLRPDRIHELDEAYGRLSTVMNDASSRFEENVKVANAALAQRVDGAVGHAVGQLSDFVQNATSDVASSQKAIHDASAGVARAMSANSEALLKHLTGVIDDARASLREFVKAAALEMPAAALAAAVTDVTASLLRASAGAGELSTSLKTLDGRAGVAVKNVDNFGSSAQTASTSAAAMGEALGRFSTGSKALDFEPVRSGVSRLAETLQRLDSIAVDAERRYATTSTGAVGSMQAHVEDLKKATELLSGAFVAVSRELDRSMALLAEQSRR